MPGGVYIRRWQLYMTPKTRAAMHAQLSVPPDRDDERHSVGVNVPVGVNEPFTVPTIKMTLCGSEVPQDRWRGRTAGCLLYTSDAADE